MATKEERYNEALAIVQKGDFAKAVPLMEALANEGFAPAQSDMCSFYQNGQGVPKDNAKAIKWLTKAAEQGVAVSQFYLGSYYYAGNFGVPQDYAKAFEWFKKAAEQGEVQSQHNMGVCYHNGQGVTQDYNKAAEWYQKAAKQGYTASQETLNALKKAGVISGEFSSSGGENKIAIIGAVVLGIIIGLITGFNPIGFIVGGAAGFFIGKLIDKKLINK